MTDKYTQALSTNIARMNDEIIMLALPEGVSIDDCHIEENHKGERYFYHGSKPFLVIYPMKPYTMRSSEGKTLLKCNINYKLLKEPR